ncbi:hypothetical protein WKT22_04452 [Candidatus Lokiarchaeum ossiferum]
MKNFKFIPLNQKSSHRRNRFIITCFSYIFVNFNKKIGGDLYISSLLLRTHGKIWEEKTKEYNSAEIESLQIR